MKNDKREESLGEEFDFEDLDMDGDTEDVPEEGHNRLSMIVHLGMALAAIVIVVIIAAVLLLKNNPIVYNEIDASGIKVSGVYQDILEWEQSSEEKNGAEHYVEDKVSITTLTLDSQVPSVLLEGVLTEVHGMQVCFSEDKARGYYAACFSSGNTTYLLESEEINKKQFTKAVEQFIKDQY